MEPLSAADEDVIFEKFKNLQNVWIGDPTFKQVSRLKDKKNLRYLALGRQDGSEESNVQLSK